MLEQMFEKLFSIGEHFEIENGVCKQTDKTHDTLSGCASPLESLQVRQRSSRLPAMRRLSEYLQAPELQGSSVRFLNRHVIHSINLFSISKVYKFELFNNLLSFAKLSKAYLSAFRRFSSLFTLFSSMFPTNLQLFPKL